MRRHNNIICVKMNPRERAAMEYAEKLRETYKEHPQIKRIARHRYVEREREGELLIHQEILICIVINCSHVPKSVYSAAKEHKIIKQSEKKKESNRRVHAAEGEVRKEKGRERRGRWCGDMSI